MNYQLTPDLAAMAILLVILFFLRRRHPQESVDLWFTGLLFIFLEATAHAFYTPRGRWHLTSHVIALDSYLAAGGIFLWAAVKPLLPRSPTLRYFAFNTPALLALLTTYGLDIRTPGAYLVFITIGLVLGIVSPFVLARTWKLGRAWWLIFIQLCIWLPALAFVSAGLYRDAAYYLLFAIYFITGVVFQISLPAKSMGKVAIVLGLTVWSFVFLLHSWVTNHPRFIDIAGQIWDMQKFLVTIGLMLVMLERQVASNEWHAFHDQLTGLPNRRLFEQRLTQAIHQAQINNTRTALLLLDLNGFKLINDSLGHETGDQLLRHISINLRNVVRASDTLARLGGDEFILIATDLPTDQPVAVIAERSLQRILQALAKPVFVAGNALTVTGSVGIAIFPDDSTDEILLRRLADQRMYQQKRQVSGISKPYSPC